MQHTAPLCLLQLETFFASFQINIMEMLFCVAWSKIKSTGRCLLPLITDVVLKCKLLRKSTEFTLFRQPGASSQSASVNLRYCINYLLLTDPYHPYRAELRRSTGEAPVKLIFSTPCGRRLFCLLDMYSTGGEHVFLLPHQDWTAVISGSIGQYSFYILLALLHETFWYNLLLRSQKGLSNSIILGIFKSLSYFLNWDIKLRIKCMHCIIFSER